MSWIVTIETTADRVDIMHAELWDHGTTGVAELPAAPEGPTRLLAGFDNESVARQVADSFGGSVSAADPSVWQTPLSVTVTVGDCELQLDATDAFGHGEHPTTRLILDQLSERAANGHIPATVFDIGSGTGVLSIAALVLGQRSDQVGVAVDNEPAAIAATERNAAHNGVADQLITASDIGSVESADGPSLILINMLLADMREIAPQILALATPGSTLITSGFLDTQLDEVSALFSPLERCGFTTSDDWVCATFVAHPSPTKANP